MRSTTHSEVMEALRTVGHGWLYSIDNGHSLAILALLQPSRGLAEVDRELSDGSICAHLTEAAAPPSEKL